MKDTPQTDKELQAIDIIDYNFFLATNLAVYIIAKCFNNDKKE